MKEKNIWIRLLMLGVGFLLLFVCAVIYGAETKKTYINDTDFNTYIKNKELKVLYYHYPFDQLYDVYGEGAETIQYQELADSADLIVRAGLEEGSKREIYQECVLSELKVKKVYQGRAQGGDLLRIFEPVNCTGIKGMLLCSEGYSPMQEGKEYILFLKSLKNSLFGPDKFVYIPSTLTYSKYEVSEQLPQRFRLKELENERLKYKAVKSQEVLLYNKNMYEQFLQLKKEVLENHDFVASANRNKQQ